MKAVVSAVFGLIYTYFGIGAVLGLILEVSYLWGSTFGAPGGIGFLGHVALVFTMTAIGAIGLVVRTFLWLPSLIFWYLSDEPITFLFWLMPGLFVEAG